MNTNVYENTDSETITPLNKRRILPVFLLVGLYAASTAAVMSVLPFYIREMGGSPLIIGIIIATEAFSQFCAAPLIGHLSDRVGRKRILIVTLAIAAISLLLLANAQCILFILLARTLFGISAGNLSAAAAYIADCTHVRNRRQAIGILTGCIGLGGIVGGRRFRVVIAYQSERADLRRLYTCPWVCPGRDLGVKRPFHNITYHR